MSTQGDPSGPDGCAQTPPWVTEFPGQPLPEDKPRRSLPMFERPDLCAPCGGACCKRMPGVAMPHDFGLSPGDDLGVLDEALRSGRWSLDWWEGDPREEDAGMPRALFLRPRIVDAHVVDPSWGGRCSWLTDYGCGTPEERPSGCRGVEPGTDGCFSRHSSKQDAATAWIPFASGIEKLARKYKVRNP